MWIHIPVLPYLLIWLLTALDLLPIGPVAHHKDKSVNIFLRVTWELNDVYYGL